MTRLVTSSQLTVQNPTHTAMSRHNMSDHKAHCVSDHSAVCLNADWLLASCTKLFFFLNRPTVYLLICLFYAHHFPEDRVQLGCPLGKRDDFSHYKKLLVL